MNYYSTTYLTTLLSGPRSQSEVLSQVLSSQIHKLLGNILPVLLAQAAVLLKCMVGEIASACAVRLTHRTNSVRLSIHNAVNVKQVT